MRNVTGYLLAVLATLLFASPLARADSDKVKAQLLADVSAIAPGRPFMLGIKFTIEPGWHIYWKNPGDSGLPTEVKLNLPEGFTAGELTFPIPARLQLPGDVVNYAYENQVMLMVKVTPAKDLPEGTPVTISAKASWLVCQDNCEPGQTQLSLDLPIADATAPANEDLFRQWTTRLPMKEDSADITSCSNVMALSNGQGQASINIGWKAVPGDIQFIPGPLKDGDVSNIKVVTSGTATKVTFDIKNFKGAEPVTGLLTFARAPDARTGLEILIPSAGTH